MGGIVFQELFQFAEAEPRVVGQERVERELEKAVQGAAPGIDGCDAGRCRIPRASSVCGYRYTSVRWIYPYRLCL